MCSTCGTAISSQVKSKKSKVESRKLKVNRSGSAEATYNRGNANIMLGQYEAAIEAYQNALSKRPGWREAEQNLQIAGEHIEPVPEGP